MDALIGQLKTWYSWRTYKAAFKSGVPGKSRSGYAAGRLAREGAIRKKIRKLQRRLDKMHLELEELVNERRNREEGP